MKKQIRDALVYGPWQAHVVWFLFALAGWFVAMGVRPGGPSALIGLAVGGIVGLVAIKRAMSWK